MEQACGCDSKKLKFKGEKDGYNYYTCMDCGCSFGVPKEDSA